MTPTPPPIRCVWLGDERFGVQSPSKTRATAGSSLSSYSLPNIVGNITVRRPLGRQAVGGFAETTSGAAGLQAAATFKLDTIAPATSCLKAWAQGQVGLRGRPGLANGSSVWSALASFQHFWSPTLSSAVTFSYLDYAALAPNNACGAFTATWCGRRHRLLAVSRPATPRRRLAATGTNRAATSAAVLVGTREAGPRAYPDAS